MGCFASSTTSASGISVLPKGSVFAIEHRSDAETILVSQVLASPIDGGIARILLRLRAPRAITREVVGPRARVRLGAAEDRITWEGVTRAVRHRVTLRALPDKTAWLWRVDASHCGTITRARWSHRA
jgi:hypothetical protein